MGCIHEVQRTASLRSNGSNGLHRVAGRRYIWWGLLGAMAASGSMALTLLGAPF